MSTINGLSKELLTSVFSYLLDDPKTLGNISAVSQLFHQVVEDPALCEEAKKKLKLSKIDQNLPTTALGLYTKRFRKLDKRFRKLEECVIGQKQAIKEVFRTLYFHYCQLSKMPTIFYFVGPSSSGKTKFAETIAEVFERNLLKSICFLAHETENLISGVKKNPDAFILFEAMTKADRSILMMLPKLFVKNQRSDVDADEEIEDFSQSLWFITSTDMRYFENKLNEIAQQIPVVHFQPLQEDAKITIMHSEVKGIVARLESSYDIKYAMNANVWLPLINDLDIRHSIQKLDHSINALINGRFMDRRFERGDHIMIERKKDGNFDLLDTLILN